MLKTVSSITNAIGALNYKGTWNAATNNPVLTSGVGTKGDYYVVSVAGSTNLDGQTLWGVGDMAVFNGTAWQKVDGGNTSIVTDLTVTTLTGYMYANNTSPVTASTTIPVANITGAVPNTLTVNAGGLLSGGGALSSNVTISLTSVPVANVPGAVPNTVNVLASGLLTGGGALTGNVTLGLTSVPVANVPGAVPNTVNVIAGGLLTGGGALTGNVTVSLANVPNANVTGLGTMATQNSNAVTITGGSINAQAVNHTGNTSISATMSNASLLLVPAGYLYANVNSTVVKIPYYAI